MNSYKKYLKNKEINKTKLTKYLTLIYDDLYYRVERIKQKKRNFFGNFWNFFPIFPISF